MPLNVRVAGGDLPLPGALGALLSGAAFVALLAFHERARWVGLGWMAFGVLVYVYYRMSEDKPLLKRITVPEQVLTRQRTRGRVRLDPRADPGLRARRRHRPDRGAAGLRGGRGLRRGRRGDRGAVDLRGAAHAAARHARAGRRAQARAGGAGAGQGGGGGVRGRRGGDRGGARPPRRRGDRARGQAARRRGDRAGRRGAGAHARRRAVRRQGGPARHLRRRDHPLRDQQGAPAASS